MALALLGNERTDVTCLLEPTKGTLALFLSLVGLRFLVLYCTYRGEREIFRGGRAEFGHGRVLFFPQTRDDLVNIITTTL